MTGKRKHMPEGQRSFSRLAALPYNCGERLGSDAAIGDLALRFPQQAFEQCLRDCDRVSVKPERHRSQERRLDLADPKRNRDCGGSEHVCRIEMTSNELVADIGPGRLGY